MLDEPIYAGYVAGVSSAGDVSTAWARIRILLNLGQADEADRLANSALPGLQFNDFEDLFRLGGVSIYGMDDIPPGWCFLHRGQQLALLNRDVAREFSAGLAMYDFCAQAERITRPRWRRYDTTSWARIDQSQDD